MEETVLPHRISRLVIAGLLLGLIAPGLARAADPPGRCADAVPLAPGWSSDAVAGADADWHRFSLTQRRTVILTLGGLSANARLRLFKGCGTLVATSDRAGTHFEEIQRRLEPGTYRVVVDAVAAAPAATGYDLRLRIPPQRVVVLSSRAWIEGPNLRIVGEVLNNSDRPREDVALRFIFYDAAGELIPPLDWQTFARRERLAPRQRSMFVLDYQGIPADYDHFRVVVEASPVAGAPPIGGLVVHRGQMSTDESGTRHVTGTLENRNAFHVSEPRVLLTLYDRWGRVLNTDFVDTRDGSPGPLAAGASHPFKIELWSHWSNADRAVLSSHGYRFVAPAAPARQAQPD